MRLAARLALVLALALLAVLGVVAVAEQTQPLEDCFSATASWSPAEPDPGDVLKVVFYPCSGGLHDYAIRFYGESIGYKLLDAGQFEGYRYEVHVNLPLDRGYVELELDGSVLDYVSVGGASTPGTKTETTTQTKNVLDVAGLDYKKLAVLAGAGAVAVVGLAMAVFGRRG